MTAFQEGLALVRAERRAPRGGQKSMSPEGSRSVVGDTLRRVSVVLLVLGMLAFAPRDSAACGLDLRASYQNNVSSNRAILFPVAAEAMVVYSSTFRVCGAPSALDPYVQHGHPTTNGTMTFSITQNPVGDFNMSFDIDLGTTRQFRADHAHFYNPDNGYDNSDVGESTICWAEIRGATALVGNNWPGTNADSLSRFYRRWLEQVALDNGQGWWLNVHMYGGHFATDETGHLIEWPGEFPSFGGTNTVRPECDAHQKRKLDNRRLVSDNVCHTSNATRRNARNFYLDQMGVAWLDSAGDLTANAVAHGYDLETDYLFFPFGDEGRSRQWGGPDGGIGGRLDGSEDARCDEWPVAGWGEPHHHVPEPAQALLALAALLTVSGLRRKSRKSERRK